MLNNIIIKSHYNYILLGPGQWPGEKLSISDQIFKETKIIMDDYLGLDHNTTLL